MEMGLIIGGAVLFFIVAFLYGKKKKQQRLSVEREEYDPLKEAEKYKKRGGRGG